jgi:hypothetical protein
MGKFAFWLPIIIAVLCFESIWPTAPDRFEESQ